MTDGNVNEETGDRTAQAQPGSGAASGSEAEAWQDGWKCGRSPTGMFDENPHTHRLSKKRKAWHMGWMAGGAIYLTKCDACDGHHENADCPELKAIMEKHCKPPNYY